MWRIGSSKRKSQTTRTSPLLLMYLVCFMKYFSPPCKQFKQAKNPHSSCEEFNWKFYWYFVAFWVQHSSSTSSLLGNWVWWSKWAYGHFSGKNYMMLWIIITADNSKLNKYRKIGMVRPFLAILREGFWQFGEGFGLTNVSWRIHDLLQRWSLHTAVDSRQIDSLGLRRMGSSYFIRLFTPHWFI